MVEGRYRSGRPIVLVGMMGAGKTTVGRLLAARLGLPFADSDEAVEQAAAMSVAQLFERRGEPGFREEERAAVERLLDGPAGVVAVGGGAFADAALRARILARAIAVWLDADVATLAARAAGSGRPLLPALPRLAAERRPAYAQAQVRVAAEGAPETVVEAILAALAEPAR